MEDTTDFVGHIDIEPALNEAEIDYLTDLVLPGRDDPPEGLGERTLTCQWVPCTDGSRLILEEGENRMSLSSGCGTSSSTSSGRVR